VHVVRPGETLWRISRGYGTTVEAIAQANGISDVTRIGAGQRLWIPTDGVARPAKPAGFGAIDPRGRTAANSLIWPLAGRITSGFGMRDGAHHDGLDIKAPEGTAVRAAEAGRVVHSGNSLSGYGNMIILKHAGSLATVYAHNRRNLVRVGEFVEKGAVIAEVGRTGNASTPHVHFEVRRNGSPMDPLDYLP
jgi:murein DD-endopeptidase MepM/ murein hydrolase activator NlpD